MDIAGLVRHMVAMSGKSQRQISLDLGKSGSWLSTTLYNGGNMRVDTLCEVAGACGYDLMVSGHGESFSLVLDEMSDATIEVCADPDEPHSIVFRGVSDDLAAAIFDSLISGGAKVESPDA